MSDTPLEKALGKVGDGGDVAVQVPEWSNQGGLILLARAVIALLLFALVSTIVWNVGRDLPGESDQRGLSTALQERAAEATATTATARSALRSATKHFEESTTTLSRSKSLDPPDPKAVRSARSDRAEARSTLRAKRQVYHRREEQRAAAFEDALGARPSSDIDLVRAIGVGALALLALLGAAALLAPRRSQLLSVRRLFPPVPGGTPAPEVEEEDVVGGVDASGAPAAGPQPSAGVTKQEPALTQGFIASAALIAGLFGIQNVEGPAETVLNAVLPLVPIIGALFVRSRVAARPNIRGRERARLFTVA